MLNNKYPFTLPALPYGYNDLEPVLDSETLQYHHDKHFQAYVNNLNAALQPYPELQQLTLRQLLDGSHPLPEAAKTAILNNGGGVYNHDLYFKGLSPVTSGKHMPEGKLLDLINQTYGSFDQFKALFTKEAMSVFGSGWTFLVIDTNGKLSIVNTKNQDTVVPMNLVPLLIFDVWEHAYYLIYKNLRANYIEGLWTIANFPVL